MLCRHQEASLYIVQVFTVNTIEIRQKAFRQTVMSAPYMISKLTHCHVHAPTELLFFCALVSCERKTVLRQIRTTVSYLNNFGEPRGFDCTGWANDGKQNVKNVKRICVVFE